MVKRKGQKPISRVYAPHSVDEVKEYLGFRVWRSEDRQIHTELLVKWLDENYSHQWTPTTEQDLPEWTESQIVSKVVLLERNYAQSIRELFTSQLPYENKCLEVYIRDDQALIGVSRAPVKVNGAYQQLLLEDDPAADHIKSVPHIRKITEDVEVDEDEWNLSSGTTRTTTMAVRQVKRTTWRKITSISRAGAQLENTKFMPSSTVTVIKAIIKDKKPLINDPPEEFTNFEMKLGHVRANEAHIQLNKMQNCMKRRRVTGGFVSDCDVQPENNENESNENIAIPNFRFYKSLLDITVWSDSCSDGNCISCTETSEILDHFLRFFSRSFQSISNEIIKFMKNHLYKILTGEKVDDDGLLDGFDHLHRFFCPEGVNDSTAENGGKVENLYQLYLKCSHCEIIIDCLVAVGQIEDYKKEPETEQFIGLNGEVFEHLRGIVCDAIASKKKSADGNVFKQLALQETGTTGLTPLSLATVTTEGGQRPETLIIETPNHGNRLLLLNGV